MGQNTKLALLAIAIITALVIYGAVVSWFWLWLTDGNEWSLLGAMLTGVVSLLAVTVALDRKAS